MIYRVLFIVILLNSVILTVFAQVTLSPNDNQITPVIINEYTHVISTVPAEPVLSTQWYSNPKDITQHFDLHNIHYKTHYFENDVPYLEKTVDDIKGRLFLKEVKGYRYQIFDLKFVPYFNTIKKDTPEEKKSVVPLYKHRDTGYSLVIDVVLKEKGRDLKRAVLYRYDDQINELYKETYLYTNKGAVQRLVRTYASGALQRFVYYFSTGGLKEIFYQDPDGSTYLLSYTLAGALATKLLYNIDAELIYELTNTYDEYDKLAYKIEIDYNAATSIESEYTNEQLMIRKTYLLKEYVKQSEKNKKQNVLDNQSVDSTIDSTIDQSIDSTIDPTIDSTIDQSTQGTGTKAVSKSKTEDRVDQQILLRTDIYQYNPSGNQISTESTNLLHEDITSTSYVEDTEVESLYRNGILKKEIIKEGDKQTEVFYFRGKLVYKIYYQRNKKIKEEVFDNGEILETRIIE